MIVGFSFLSFISLKSFCAQRSTPKVALCGIIASLRSVVYLQTLGGTQRGGVTGFSFLDLLFHMDMVSRRLWVASNLLRYIPILSTQAIASTCGVSGSEAVNTTTVFSIQKPSLVYIFLFYINCSNMLFMFLNKCSHAEHVKEVAVLGKS